MKKEWVEKIRSSVLTNADFAGMSDEELDRWIVSETERLLADEQLTIGEKSGACGSGIQFYPWLWAFGQYFKR